MNRHENQRDPPTSSGGGTARLFVAVWPPPPVVARLAALDRPEVAGLRWTTADQWHVTLRFLGTAVVAEASAALRAVDWPGAGTVEAVLGPATGRFGRRILHVPVAGLAEVASAVVAATAGVGEPPDDRAFHGHVTLARARGRGGVDLAGLAGVAVSGRWTVSEVTLVASRLGAGGARYEVVERVALP